MNTPPDSLPEYLWRFHQNEHITGVGFGNVYIHMPCPFCAAADWLVYELLEVREKLGVGATCSECGRSARAIYDDPSDAGVSFEVVQIGGPDQPAWLLPKMRRWNSGG